MAIKVAVKPTDNEFTLAYPHIFAHRTTLIRLSGALRDVIIVKAKDRTLERENVTAELLAEGIELISEMRHSVSNTEETLVLQFNSKEQQIGFKGSGPQGAEITTIAEEAQTIYCALDRANMDLEYDNVVKSSSKVRNAYRINGSAANTMKKLPRQWQLSCQRAAPVINNALGPGQFIFHRGSGIADRVSQTFARLNRKLAKPFTNLNKWNPSDIWAVRSGFNPAFSTIKSIEEFNAYLAEQMIKKNLVGFSLKMSIKPIVSYVNVGDGKPPADKTSFKYASCQYVNPKADLLSSKTSTINMKLGMVSYKFEIRSEKPLQTVSVEIKGNSARHGKMTYGIASEIITDITKKPLPKLTITKDKAIKNDPKLVDEIYRIAQTYDNPRISKEKFIEGITTTKNADWVWSKYLGGCVLEQLYTASSHVRDQIIDGLITHASSTSELSAPFMKVS